MSARPTAPVSAAQEIGSLLESAAREAAGSELTLAELVVPIVLGTFARRLGRRKTAEIVAREMISLEGAPSEPRQRITACVRAPQCPHDAVVQRLQADGGWKPVCTEHKRGATPMELRSLAAGS